VSSNVSPAYAGKPSDRTGVMLQGRSGGHDVKAYGRRDSSIDASIVLSPGCVVYAYGVFTQQSGASAYSPQAPLYTFRPGVAVGSGPPIFLLSGDNDFDVTLAGAPAGTPAYGNTAYPLPAIAAMPGYSSATGVLQGVFHGQGFEFETTEFDTAQTYAQSAPVRACTSIASAEALSAGRLTNKGNTGAGNPGFTSAAFTVGTDTTVGFSLRTYTNAYRRPVLSIIPFFSFGTR